MESIKKIAISNLAFADKSLDQSLKFLRNSQIEGLELAPTLIWEEPELVSKNEIENFKALVSDHGLQIVALQSLLYNQPQLQLFRDCATRERLLGFLKKMVVLCSVLGGQSLSFGSPRNRIKGNLSIEEAIAVITPLFHTLAEFAKKFEVVICIEPISSFYNCDFINNTEEAVQLIESVGHPHFKLLLDVGTLILNNENFETAIRNYAPYIAHIHINDPKLHPPSKRVKEHPAIAQTLNSVGYSGWMTLEFLNHYTSFEKDLTFGLECYRFS